MECVTGGDEYSNQLAKEMDTLKVSKFISLKVNGKEINLDNTDFGEDFYHDIVVENKEEHIPDEDLLLKTEKARNELIIKTPGGNTKSMAIGAYDIKTGAVAADFAGPIPEKISDV